MLEYIEPMCIEAHLEAHVYVLYIPTHLGLEEYNNYYPPTIIIHDTFFSGGKLFNFKNMAAANEDVKISSYKEDNKQLQHN